MLHIRDLYYITPLLAKSIKKQKTSNPGSTFHILKQPLIKQWMGVYELLYLETIFYHPLILSSCPSFTNCKMSFCFLFKYRRYFNRSACLSSVCLSSVCPRKKDQKIGLVIIVYTPVLSTTGSYCLLCIKEWKKHSGQFLS